jgi:NAD(P)-dependent dehydrogenase (short-subunit alcohol dehydrogenase family)
MLKDKVAMVMDRPGVGLAITRALPQAGCNNMLNGSGEPAAIDCDRAQIEKDFASARHSGPRTDEAAPIAALVDATGQELGSVDILVNNAACAVRVQKFPVEQWGRRHGHHFVSELAHYACRFCAHVQAQLEPHHQYRLCTRSCRSSGEGCLRPRQARRRRDRGRLIVTELA